MVGTRDIVIAGAMHRRLKADKDDQRGFIIQPVGDTNLHVGGVGRGRCTLDNIQHQCIGLGFKMIQADQIVNTGPVKPLLRIMGETGSEPNGSSQNAHQPTALCHMHRQSQ